LDGEDFDNRLVIHFSQEFMRKFKKDLSTNGGLCDDGNDTNGEDDSLYSRFFRKDIAIAREHRARLTGDNAYFTSSLLSAAPKASALGASAAFETSAPIASAYAAASGASATSKAKEVERVFADLRPKTIVAAVSSQFVSNMIMLLTAITLATMMTRVAMITRGMTRGKHRPTVATARGLS
jgi:hypothetical protein